MSFFPCWPVLSFSSKKPFIFSVYGLGVSFPRPLLVSSPAFSLSFVSSRNRCHFLRSHFPVRLLVVARRRSARRRPRALLLGWTGEFCTGQVRLSPAAAYRIWGSIFTSRRRSDPGGGESRREEQNCAETKSQQYLRERFACSWQRSRFSFAPIHSQFPLKHTRTCAPDLVNLIPHLSVVVRGSLDFLIAFSSRAQWSFSTSEESALADIRAT